jgi:hypothetical protein
VLTNVLLVLIYVISLVLLLNLLKKAVLVATYTKGTGDMGMVEDVGRTIADEFVSTSSAPRTRRPPGYRLIVSGVSRDTSWQV